MQGFPKKLIIQILALYGLLLSQYRESNPIMHITLEGNLSPDSFRVPCTALNYFFDTEQQKTSSSSINTSVSMNHFKCVFDAFVFAHGFFLCGNHHCIHMPNF